MCPLTTLKMNLMLETTNHKLGMQGANCVWFEQDTVDTHLSLIRHWKHQGYHPGYVPFLIATKVHFNKHRLFS